jgi:hypothetical protein
MPETITEELDELIDLLGTTTAVEVEGQYVRKFTQYDSERIDEIVAG